jgi:hypothetical protein
MRCTKCGAENPDGAKFCRVCGENVEYYLNIQREKQWFLIPIAIQIFIDGNMVSLIQSGDNLNFPVSEGIHNVIFKASFRKTEIDITVKQNSTVLLRFNRITGKIDVGVSGSSVFIKKHN